MAIKNTSELKDARTNKYAPDFGGGIGFEIYQFVMGGVAAFVVALIFWLLNVVLGINLLFFGIGLALVVGYAAAMWPNYINTRHKDTKTYIRDEYGKRTHHRLVINDRRVPEPADEREHYFASVAEFPQTRDPENHD
jgi:hypothetical protein